VKRSEFVRSLVRRGCYLLRHGSRHDIYANPKTGRKAPVPRHSEIKDSLARMIELQLDVD
jgi:mRNA interferase HicA